MTTNQMHMPTRFGQPADCRNCQAKLIRRGNTEWRWMLDGKPAPWCALDKKEV